MWIILAYFSSGIIFIMTGHYVIGFILLTIYGGALSILMVISSSLISPGFTKGFKNITDRKWTLLVFVLLYLLCKTNELSCISEGNIKVITELFSVEKELYHPMECLSETCWSLWKIKALSIILILSILVFLAGIIRKY